MYLEADARMDTFQAQDGTQQTRLNLVQRKTNPALHDHVSRPH